MNERSIFLEAIEKHTPHQRAAFLDQVCADDPALRQRVDALLASHVEAGSFLEKPLPERLAGPADPLTLGNEPSEKQPATGFHSLEFLSPSEKPDSLGRLGSYEIEELIGAGGMGIVLRAFDERLHRAVAIKVMTPPLATNEHARRRFVREGRAAAAIRDDHVIGIHGVDEAAGLPFLVMEYIIGRSLGQRLEAEGPLPVTDILRIGGQIARGLAAAHTQGVVHRDIKPANILLENGVERVKITDFGLAHAVDDVRTTRPGTVIGTPEYMSPEQARGERVDHRSDLFSLGCVLYAMCAGRPPFRAESTVAIIRRVCDDTPRPLSEINPDIPSWLTHIIDRLISKDPSHRFQSAAEVADLLEQCLAHLQECGAGVPPAISVGNALRGVPCAAVDGHSTKRNARDGVPYSARVPGIERSSTPASRSHWALAAAIIVLLGVGLTLAESTGLTTLSASVIRIVRGDGTLVVEVDDPNVQILVDGEELVITGAGPKELRLRPGKHELQTVKEGQPSETKLITITRDGRQVVRVTREISKAAQAGVVNRQVLDNAPATFSVSLDGRLLAYTDEETGQLAVRDLATGQQRLLTAEESENEPASAPSVVPKWPPPGYKAWSPSFSSDGRLIAYWWRSKQPNKKELRVISVNGGTARTVFPPPHGGEEGLSGWTLDNRFVLANLYDESKQTLELTRISIADGSTTVIKSYPAKNPSSVLSPDGKTVAWSRETGPGSSERSLFLLDIATGRETLVPTPTAKAWPNTWTPDSKALLYETERLGKSELWMIRITAGQPQGEPRLVRSDWSGEDLSVTRDGTLYYGTWSGGSRAGPLGESRIYTAALDLEKGTATATLLPAERLSQHLDFYTPAWSRDGQYLAYKAVGGGQSQELKVVSITTGETRVLKPFFHNLNTFFWSPDGKEFITASDQQPQRAGIYRINAITGKVTTVVEPPADETFPPAVANPRWSTDGQDIYYIKQAKSIVRRNLQSNAEREIIGPDNGVAKVISMVPSPDGRQLRVNLVEQGSSNVKTKLIDIESGKTELVAGIGRAWTTWTPDMRSLIYLQREAPGGKSSRLCTSLADGSQPRELKVEGFEPRFIQYMTLHPDGKQLAFTTLEPRKYQIWALENFLPPLDDPKAAAAPAAATPTSKIAPPVPATRLVWDKAPYRGDGVVSPDGRYIVATDWESGDLSVRDLTTGTSRRLTGERYPKLAQSPIISPDSRQVAYWWRNEKGHNLRISDLDGSGSRMLYTVDGILNGDATPHAWTPDGKQILATVNNKVADKLALISTTDGSIRVLDTDEQSPSAWNMRISPDGRYIACSNRVPNTRQRDIYVLPIKGGQKTALVQHAADDFLLGWTPDGKRLLFTSNRTGSMGIWLVAVADGKAVGTPTLIKSEVGDIDGMGITSSGTLYYGVEFGGNNVYTAQIDAASGKLLSSPVEAIQHHVGFNFSPDWSPDGKYLACQSIRGPGTSFLIRSLATGQVRVLWPNSMVSFNVHSLRWSPDGRHLLVGSPGRRIDVEQGDATAIAADRPTKIQLQPMLTPDGKTLFHQLLSTPRPIFRYDLATGSNTVLYRPEQRARSLTLSPDGQQLAFDDGKRLKLLSATGGEAQSLLTTEYEIQTIAWMPDGKHLLYGLSTGDAENAQQVTGQLWRVPLSGGGPHKLADDLPAFTHLRVHPDGGQIAFHANNPQAAKHEIWALENFLPPLTDPKPAATLAQPAN